MLLRLHCCPHQLFQNISLATCSICRFSAEIEYFLSVHPFRNVEAHHFPLMSFYQQYVLLTSLCERAHVFHFKWRTNTVRSSFASLLGRDTSWFNADLWLQQTGLTKEQKESSHDMLWVCDMWHFAFVWYWHTFLKTVICLRYYITSQIWAFKWDSVTFVEHQLLLQDNGTLDFSTLPNIALT